jgi:hypothetical protein
MEHMQKQMAQMDILMNSMTPEMRRQLEDMMEGMFKDSSLQWDIVQLAAISIGSATRLTARAASTISPAMSRSQYAPTICRSSVSSRAAPVNLRCEPVVAN